ncbi:MAG: prolyl oligopeptidase family serine peptidase [Bacteriovorax sp.]|nr:prolyl oligopeptidase family serine peptidase [Bacteriovorax sp.]
MTDRKLERLLYLEDVEGEKALEWAAHQTQQATDHLKQDPRFASVFEDILTGYQDKNRLKMGIIHHFYYYNFWQDEINPKGLWRRIKLSEFNSGNWDNLFDFDKWFKDTEENLTYSSFEPHPDPKNDHLVMLSLSVGGKDANVIREFDLIQKIFVNDGFNLSEAKQTFAWRSHDEILIAVGKLTNSGYPGQLLLLKRHQKIENAKVLFKTSKENMGLWVTHYEYTSDGLEKKMIALDERVGFYTGFSHIIDEDQVKKLNIPEDAELLCYYENSFVFRLKSLWNSFLADSVLISTISSLTEADSVEVECLWSPKNRISFQSFFVNSGKFFIRLSENVLSSIFELKKKDNSWGLERITPDNKSTFSMVAFDQQSELAIIAENSFLIPTTLHLYNSKSAELTLFQQGSSRFSSVDFEVEQWWSTSLDGEKIPYFIIKKKNLKFDGQNPVWLYGYGGFEISLEPFYLGMRGKLWLEKGGVFVWSNIRGGGEFGPSWHQAALKMNRHLCYQDFSSIAEDLIQRKLTNEKKILIAGGSNGGLLVGTSFTKRPELFKAVICAVPLLDMIRSHLLHAGASWVAEYGSPEEGPEMKAYLESYSPLQNVKPGVQYPATFFHTSTYDDRVHPGHARKMAARMIEENQKVYFHEEREGGHQGRTSPAKNAENEALHMIFAYQELGIS